MMSDLPEQMDFQQSLYHVATLAAVNPSSGDLSSLHAGLVLRAMASLDRPANADAIADEIRRQTHIRLAPEIVSRSAQDLVGEGQLKHQADLLVLPETTSDLLQSDTQRFEQKRVAVLEEWVDRLDEELEAIGEQILTSQESYQLREDLEAFLLQLVRYHGVELALFLYPGCDVDEDVMATHLGDFFRSLPKRGDRVEQLRKRTLPGFVREAEGERAEYIAALLHRAALLSILQADPSAKAVFAEVLEQKTIYLDTNLVFRILGFQGRRLHQAALDALRLGAKLDHEFRISGKTYEELRNLISRQAGWSVSGEEIPRELAGVASEFLAGNDYVQAYLHSRSRHGTSAAHFKESVTRLSLLLENYDIQIDNALAEDIAGSDALKQAIQLLMPYKPSGESKRLEHDAWHKVLIEKLRNATLGRQPESWFDMSHVFLTCDNKLPAYAADLARKSMGHRVPFCLLSHEWLQILYFAQPDVAVPSAEFVRLMNSPYLESYFSQRTLDRNIVRDIVVQMERLRELRPDVARKVLADRALVRRLEATSSENERERLIKDAVREQSRAEDECRERELERKDARIAELEENLQENERRTRELYQEQSGQRRVMKARRVDSRRKLDDLRRTNEETRAALEGERQEREALEVKVADVNAFRERIDALQQESEDWRRQVTSLKRWLLVLPSLVLLYGAYHTALGTQPRLLYAALGLSGLLVLGAAAFRGLGESRWKYVNRAAGIVALLGAIWEYAPGLKEWVKRLLETS